MPHMRVLFVPFPTAPISHVLPLLALDTMLRDSDIETAFLLPRGGHPIVSQVTDCVLDIDHQGFRTEMEAYAKFAPDVVVDDASPTTLHAARLTNTPRVAIQRTGMFPGTVPRHAHHRHSMGLQVDQMADVTFMGLEQPKSFADLFEARIKIVPGIRTIEALPPAVRDDPSYVFAGPLIMPDYMVDQVGYLDSARRAPAGVEFKSLNPVLEFLARQRGHQKVYLTFGSVARAMPVIFDCIRWLLDQGIAVVTSVKVDELTDRQRELYYHAVYLPLHLVCSNIDLAIHHCGSATYHYPILHNVPAITIGTLCYDRDDVAARLEELGASEHIPSPEECPDFAERFRAAVERYFDTATGVRRRRTEQVARLRQEIAATQAAFDFEDVLESALSA
jgi:UDP:flavonoid glycosyltransferase YjiC (YdhE family)